MRQRFSMNSNEQAIQKNRMQIEQEMTMENNQKKFNLLNQRRGIQQLNSGMNETEMKEPVNPQSLKEAVQFIISNSNLTNIKYELLLKLKTIRKEFTKTDMTKEILMMILSKYPNFLAALEYNLLDFNNSEIQFESIWIINNLCIYGRLFQIQTFYLKIGQMLTQLLLKKNNFSNIGAQNLILEKLFSCVGNLVPNSPDALNLLLANNILRLNLDCLSSAIIDLRSVALWSLNVLFDCISANQNLANKYLNQFFDFQAIRQYQSIINKIHYNVNLDEVYEFYWLVNDLLNVDQRLANALFFSFSLKEVSDNFKELIKKSLIDRLSQPAIRLMTNLFLLSNNDITKQNMIDDIFSEQMFIIYVGNVLTSQFGQYSMDIVRDILFLLDNLCIYVPDKIKANFFDKLVILSSNDRLWNDFSIKIFVSIYYRIVIFNQGNFGKGDETILGNFYKYYSCFSHEEISLLTLIDIFYLYVGFHRKNVPSGITEQVNNIRNNPNNYSQVNLKSLLEFILSVYLYR